MRRSYRRATGNNSMRKKLQSIIADTPLVKNLYNPEYMDVILDDKKSLKDAFAEISQQKVMRKMQDAKSKGNMWIGTSNGINRYSGCDFKQYNLTDYAANTDNCIAQIINNNGIIWIIGSGGILLTCRYEFDDFIKEVHIPDLVFYPAASWTINIWPLDYPMEY